jgi:hypothetical protein
MGCPSLLSLVLLLCVATQIKGIVQPFELGGVTKLIRSAVKFCMAGNLKKKF